MSRDHDWLLHQLPAGMLGDDFFTRYLRIFQAVGDTFLDQIDGIEHVFDPTVAPPQMVSAMGRWIVLEYIDEQLPVSVQRRVVRRYSSLVGSRGTANGLRGLLEALTGAPVEVEDQGGVYRADQAPVSVNPHVDIRVGASTAADPIEIADDDLVRIVRREVPASVTFTMRRTGRLIWPIEEEAGDG